MILSHAMLHFNETGHSVCVKLGTITKEGTADIYCYACDDERLDQKLQQHLTTFRIDMTSQHKTIKSLQELVIMNLNTN